LERVFDRNLVEQRRRRALRAAAPDADFLLQHAGSDLATRISVVERRFDRVAVIDDDAGAVAAKLSATGKVGAIEATAIGVAGEAAAETIALEPESVNLVVSALSLHLTNDTPGVLVQIRRALKPDGLFLAAVPGAGTLQELRESLLAAEAALTGGASPRVIPFADVRDYGALLQRAGFALPVADVETLTVRYDSLFQLMFDLRAMGMTNPLAGRSMRPVSRGFFEAAAEISADRFSDPDGRVRATFSIVYLSGWAPDESQQRPLKPGSAKARLADALKTKEQKLRR
jgi:SAM-dependent methyltransferase